MSSPATRGMAARERVMVALDVPDLKALEAFLDRLQGQPSLYKVGLELFVAEGERAVELVKSRGGRVFLDLKLHDIPETVARAVRSAMKVGAEFMTVHTAGGLEMLTRAAQAAENKVKLLGVTVLTSLGEDDLRADGIAGSIADTVRARARIAGRAGIPGLVCSPHEIVAARGVNPEAILVVPGIRPTDRAGSAAGDQKRIATAKQAFANGADFIVVGRPIRDAPDPARAFSEMVAEIESAGPA